MLSKLALSGLILLSLTACSTPSEVVRTKEVQRRVPIGLLVPCAIPELEANTNAALATAYLRSKQSRRACNADKSAIKEWDANLSGNE